MEKKKVLDILKEIEDDDRKIGETKIVIGTNRRILDDVYPKIIGFLKKNGWEVVKHFEKITVTPMATGTERVFARLQSAQERAISLGGQIGSMTRTAFQIFNDIVKLEQLAMLLDQYKNAKDEREKASALKRLKQYWAMKVDPTESGAGSIDNLAVRYGMSILRDAFYAVDTIEEAEKLDINERIKRILIIKLRSFYNWLDLAMEEVPRRLEFMRRYLKQHMTWIKTYLEWLKPYLRITKVLRFYRPERADVLELVDQVFVTSGLLAFKEIKRDSEEGLLCLQILLDEISRIGGAAVRPRGEAIVRKGRLEVTLRCYLLKDGEKKKLKEAIKKEEELMIEEELGSSLTEMIKEMENYLKSSEKRAKKYYERLIGEGREEEKKEKKKGFLDRLKEETEFIGPIIEFIGRIGRKKKEKKKEEKKEKEYSTGDYIKKGARDEYDKVREGLKKLLEEVVL